MPIVIETKAIKPQKLRIGDVRLELLNAIGREGTAIKKEYEKTTRTWRNKPAFEVQQSLAGGEAAVLVGTDSKIYKFIDEGTKVRYATMSKDWQSKTTPGIIGSGSGRGRMLFVRKDRPRPGIKARDFSKIIQKRRQKPFQQSMVKAMQKGADKANAR